MKVGTVIDYDRVLVDDRFNAAYDKVIIPYDHIDTTTCDCDCGSDKLDYSGFIGTENIVCPVCGKRMTDIFSPIPVSNSSCMILDPNEFEIEKDDEGNDRFWIAFDGEKQL